MSGKEALEKVRKLLSGMKGQRAAIREILALLGVVEAELQRGVVIEP